MKPTFTKVTLAIAFVISTVGIFGQFTPAWAAPESPLTPAQAHRLSRDLIPSSSQDFFQDGQEKLEREIVILQRQRSQSEPILTIRNDEINKLNELPQLELESFPSVVPSNQ